MVGSVGQPALIVGESLRDLIDPLADRLSQPLDDPFAPELVAVANLGVRQWTTRQLSRRLGASQGGVTQADGIVANIEFPFPDGLLTRLLGAPERDPWALSNLVWVVLDELQQGAGDAALGPAGRVAPGTKRVGPVPQPSSGTWYGRARHLADLFDRYSRHRPELIRQWATGNDVDGKGHPIARNPRSGASPQWQCELWRRVRARISEPSPAERLAGQIDGLDLNLPRVDLPPRLTLFGLSALPPVWFSLLPALGEHCDVAVLWLTPSLPQWRAMHERGTTKQLGAWLPDRPRARPRDGGNALLSRWSRPAQEGALLWGASGHASAPAHDEHPEPGETTTLGRLQLAIRTNRPIGELAATLPSPGRQDRSLIVHRAHGPSRQVEILRSAVAHALMEDPSLTLGDVLVLCPDVEAYGPLVAAAFAPGPGDPTAHASVGEPASPGFDSGDGLAPFPVWSAVRSPGSDHPIAQAFLGILGLVDGRATVGEVLDLLALPPVAARFGLSDDDVDQLGDWARRAGIRWGLDGEHRRAHGLPASFTATTWADGVERVLLGITTASRTLVPGLGNVIPVDIEGSDVRVIVRLAGAVAQLRQCIDEVRALDVGPRARPTERPGTPLLTLSTWIGWVLESLDALTDQQSDSDWQRRHLLEVLGDLRPESGAPEETVADPLLSVGEFRAAATESLSAVRRRGGPAEGALTLGPLQALRSVPARVICLLGIDADVLGSGTADADDLLAASPALGDRDPRADGRQLLLEEVLAAGDRLIITTTGRDPATNAEVPLPVVLSELLEELEPAEPGDAGLPGGSALITHPRHDFDAINFRAGALAADGPWSFSPVGLAEARTRGGPGDERRSVPFLDGPLPPRATDDRRGAIIELADLHRFLDGPPAAFLAQRLGVGLPRHEELGDELHPVEVDPLHKYQLHTELLQATWSVGDLDTAHAHWAAVARASGELPPGELGEAAVADVVAFTKVILGECERVGVTRPGTISVPIEVELRGGRSLRGVVTEVDPARPGPVRIGARRLKPKHELGLWLDVLALAAQDPSVPWQAIAIGRANDRTQKGIKVPAATTLQPRIVGHDDAQRSATAGAALDTLVELYLRNLSEPLPLWPETAAKLCGRKKLPTGSWETSLPGGAQIGDGNEAATREIWGDLSEHDYESLPARSDDPGNPDEPSRARRLAHVIWAAFDASVAGSLNSQAPQAAT